MEFPACFTQHLLQENAVIPSASRRTNHRDHSKLEETWGPKIKINWGTICSSSRPFSVCYRTSRSNSWSLENCFVFVSGKRYFVNLLISRTSSNFIPVKFQIDTLVTCNTPSESTLHSELWYSSHEITLLLVSTWKFQTNPTPRPNPGTVWKEQVVWKTCFSKIAGQLHGWQTIPIIGKRQMRDHTVYRT